MGKIHHYIDFTDDVNAISEVCDKHGCNVRFSFTKYSMTATISNGFEITAEEYKDVFFDEEPSLVYDVLRKGNGKTMGVCNVEAAVETVFSGDDYWDDDEQSESEMTKEDCLNLMDGRFDEVMKSLKLDYFNSFGEKEYDTDLWLRMQNSIDGKNGYKCGVGPVSDNGGKTYHGWMWEFQGKGVNKTSRTRKSFDDAIKGLKAFVWANAMKYGID